MGYSPWGRKELDTTERLSTTEQTVLQGLQSSWPPLPLGTALLSKSTFSSQKGKSGDPHVLLFFLHCTISNGLFLLGDICLTMLQRQDQVRPLELKK